MALTGAADGDIHVYLVSIRIDPTGPLHGQSIGQVVGESLIIAVFHVPVEKLENFESVFRWISDIGVSLDCEVLTSFETFANESLDLPETLTIRDSDDYIDGIPSLLWCQYTLNIKGMPYAAIKEAWRQEATMLLSKRKDMAVKLETYKVVGQPKIHAFVSMSPQEWDKLSFLDSANHQDAAVMTGVVKVVQGFD